MINATPSGKPYAFKTDISKTGFDLPAGEDGRENSEASRQALNRSRSVYNFTPSRLVPETGNPKVSACQVRVPSAIISQGEELHRNISAGRVGIF